MELRCTISEGVSQLRVKLYSEVGEEGNKFKYPDSTILSKCKIWVELRYKLYEKTKIKDSEDIRY